MKKERIGKDTGKKDYSIYHFGWKERVQILLQSIGLCAMGNYLFYESVWMWLGIIPILYLHVRWSRKQKIKEQKKQLNYQFRDALTAMNVAVQAGYSIENAVSACTRDLERLYEKETDIVKEFRYMEIQQKLSVPIEELFLDFGNRSQVEDIENFAAVFYTAKRTGGDLGKILQQTARMLGDKIDVKKEIEATLTAKKSEQMIMSLMPAGIIAYLKLTSPGFLEVLYGNVFGVCTMSICLVIYLGAYWMGKKIVDIEV